METWGVKDGFQVCSLSGWEVMVFRKIGNGVKRAGEIMNSTLGVGIDIFLVSNSSGNRKVMLAPIISGKELWFYSLKYKQPAVELIPLFSFFSQVVEILLLRVVGIAAAEVVVLTVTVVIVIVVETAKSFSYCNSVAQFWWQRFLHWHNFHHSFGNYS